jgi:ketosteroid isomerase-like protein
LEKKGNNSSMMKSALIVVCFFLSLQKLYGQKIFPELQSLIDAENSFAALSKSTSTRTAFLEYLSDSTILFEREGIVKGKKSWMARKDEPSLLFWWPVFVGISQGGDLGFTTGPWQWSESHKDKPRAQGYYATVWKKTQANKWKIATDIGISFPDSVNKNREVSIGNMGSVVVEGKLTGALNSFLSFDKQYCDQLTKKSVSFLSDYFTADSRIERNGLYPYLKPEYNNIKETELKYQFEQSGGEISNSSDIGYTYGSVRIESTQDGKLVIETKHFIRVWKKVALNDWEIILDVVGGN